MDKSKKDNGLRWSTLKHQGVLFPESFQSLPKDVVVLYNGNRIKLDGKDINNPFNISAEEAAVFFAQKIEQDRRLQGKRADKRTVLTDKLFRKNFWNDWKVILGKNHPIKDFEQVDFTPMVNYLAKQSEGKKDDRKKMTKEEKKQDKEEKEEKKQKYSYAEIDGERVVINNSIQPPGLFIGRGEAPLRGKIKRRILPADITINVSKQYVPKCRYNNKECKWGNIVENKEAAWLAGYINPVTRDHVYIFVERAQSKWVAESDQQKFEKARKLNNNIQHIRKEYTKDMKNENDESRQLATAVYLLDQLAIRPGTEKDDKEAATQGLTTLEPKNILFKGDNTIKLKFLGKDSIEFEKTIKIDSIAYKNLKELAAGNKKRLFPKVTSSSLNAYLKGLMPGLTAKVFRTWRASSILQQELDNNKVDVNSATHIKKLVYDKANIASALRLNHKRMSENTEKIQKLNEKIKELYDKQKEAKTEKQQAAVQKSIEIAEAKLEESEHNISLATSKVNYIDPRIVVSWCKKSEMPIEKIYNKSQLKKFVWSMSNETDWQF